jgi:hypothetical protein
MKNNFKRTNEQDVNMRTTIVGATQMLSWAQEPRWVDVAGQQHAYGLLPAADRCTTVRKLAPAFCATALARRMGPAG